jgi:rhamnosyltransferase
MSNPPSNLSICAIVVTYYPDISRFTSLLKATSALVDKVVVVDNTPDLKAEILHDTDWQELNVEYICLNGNFGLAHGFNKGIIWARKNEFTHVLLLDHDSIPQNEMLRCLLDAACQLDTLGISWAAVGANHIDPRSGYQTNYQRRKKESIEKRNSNLPEVCIPVQYLQSSGSLISLTSLDAIGLMDESLFIHHVDQEWCLRANSRGFHSFIVSDAIMEHVVGDKIARIWIGYWRDVHLHSPTRHYFAFRNSFLLYKREYIPRRWIFLDSLRLMFMLLFYGLLIAPRLPHISMMLRGLIHGLRGETGNLR